MLQTPTSTNVIQEGSLVVIYEGFTVKKVVKLVKGATSNTKGGTWKHDTFIGRRYGDHIKEKVKARRGTEWEQTCYLLKPNAELWTDCLMHRTQILYSCDIALVCQRLNLMPGKVVIEAGTGSGSLTHSLARTVSPTGKVFTFDFHAERSKAAAAEFAEHGLGDIVTAAHRDVCIEFKEGMKDEEWGFGRPPASADAAFLDVPSPWLAVPAVARTLRRDGIFCNFSPCIEQVQKVCATLAEAGFTSIRTHEVLRREFMEHNVQYRPMYDLIKKEDEKEVDTTKSESPTPANDATTTSPTAKRRRTDTPPPARHQTTVHHFIPTPVSRGHTGYLTFAHKVPPHE